MEISSVLWPQIMLSWSWSRSKSWLCSEVVASGAITQRWSSAVVGRHRV